MDGRQFIKDIVKPSIISHLGDNKPLVVVMNLPALAIEFLDTFVGLLQDVDLSTITRCPINVHCYCFSNGMYASNPNKNIVLVLPISHHYFNIQFEIFPLYKLKHFISSSTCKTRLTLQSRHPFGKYISMQVLSRKLLFLNFSCTWLPLLRTFDY